MVNLWLPWLQETEFVLKTMANFRKLTWNRLLDVSLVVKLLPTLKHFINVNSPKKVSHDNE